MPGLLKSLTCEASVRINLMRDALRTGLPYPPLNDSRWRPYVRLWKNLGSMRMRTPMLHLCGYQATPTRCAPRCSTGEGPYGDVEWHPRSPPVRHASPADKRNRMCPKCLEIG